MPVDDLSQEEKKAIVKEALTEWLDAKYSAFGRWTLHGIVAAALVGICYYMITHGMLKP